MTPCPRRATGFSHTLAILSLTCLANVATAGFVPVYHPELTVASTPVPITVDGLLDDAGWRHAGRAGNFAEHNPGDQVQPPVATEAWLTYDDEHLYCAWICRDDPALVRASFTERDRIWNDDYVILLLDTYGEQSWAYEIAVNPRGIQGDLLWSVTGGEDLTYDVVFTSAARITAEGWQAEMAIPWRSLRFPRRQEQVWRVDFWRNHPRAVRAQYSWAAYDRDDPCWPCKWGTVGGIAGVEPGAGLELLPAVVASQEAARRDGSDFATGKFRGEPSLSAKYNLSSSLSAEATFNPDFSQVESDAAQIDVNSTFALFYPEKRPFFQEGSDLFNTNFTVVHTRSINDPLYAGKVVGRPGRDDLAVLVARDENSPFIVPFAEQSALVAGGRSFSTLARYRHSFGSGSHVGVIGTDRRHDGGGSGTVSGVDTRLRLDRNWQVELQGLATYTEEPNDTTLTADLDIPDFDGGQHTAAFDGERFWGHGLYGSLERNGRHWWFDLDYWERSPTFRAENGFEPRNDQRLVNTWTGYTFYLEGLVERLEPQCNVARMWNFAGQRKDEWATVGLWSRLSWAQTALYGQYLRSNELFHHIQFDGIWAVNLSVDSKPSDAVSLELDFSRGDRIARGDLVLGEQIAAEAELGLKPWDRLLLETSVDYVRSAAKADGRQLFAGYVARTRLNLQITRELSCRIVLQYDGFDHLWQADPLVTFRLNPFSIFYVGSTREYREYDPTASPLDGWRLSRRTYFLKLQYLFQV